MPRKGAKNRDVPEKEEAKKENKQEEEEEEPVLKDLPRKSRIKERRIFFHEFNFVLHFYEQNTDCMIEGNN